MRWFDWHCEVTLNDYRYYILESQNGHIKKKKSVTSSFTYTMICRVLCTLLYGYKHYSSARSFFGGMRRSLVRRRIVSSVILYYNAYTGHTTGNALVLSYNTIFYSIVRTEYSISDTQYKRQFARWKVSGHKIKYKIFI